MLSTDGYDVVTAPSGPEAQALMTAQAFDLVLSDINMPGGVSGIELLQWTKIKHPQTRFMLMTGFAELMQTVDAARLGCRAFLSKPFTRQQLIEAVKEALVKVAFAEFNEENYARIPLDDFHALPHVRYPIYVRLADKRFLRIATVGDYLTSDRLMALKTKSILEVWIHKDHFEPYMKQDFEAAEALKDANAKQSGPEAHRRLVFLKGVVAASAENLRLMGISEKNIDDAAATLAATVESMLLSDTALPIMDLLEGASPSFQSHAVMSSLLASHMTRIMGWSSKKNIQIVVMGAFLHDIGLFRIPKELQHADYKTMAKESDQVAYQRHVFEGYELVKGIKGIPHEVSTIVLQHHEDAKGTGYPQGLLKSDIFPLARLVSLVDVFLGELDKLGADKRKGKLSLVLDKIVKADQLSYDANDVRVLTIALEEPDLKKARMRYAGEVKR